MIALQLIVIIGGIFAAFQVAGGSEDRQLAPEEESYLIALALDFAGTREQLERAERRYQGIIDAVITLLEYDNDTNNYSKLNHDEFYDLAADILRLTRPDMVSKTYDALVATGKIETIGDAELRSEMISFDLRWEREFLRLQYTIEPYTISRLDQLTVMLNGHPNATSIISPTRPLDQILEVIGTEDFEAIVTAKWHQTFEWLRATQLLLNRVRRIEELLARNLGDSAVTREARVSEQTR